jgi:hypothetical protein
MAFTLYAATIPSWLQILSSVARLIDKAESFVAEKGLTPEEIIQARLAEDMLPFAYQVKSIAAHSLGAVEGVRKGVFSPDPTQPPTSFDALRERIAGTIAALDAVDPDEVETFIGRDMRLRSVKIGSISLPRTSCCPFPSPIFTSTPQPLTTYFA